MRKKARIVKDNLLSIDKNYKYLGDVPESDKRLQKMRNAFWNEANQRISHYYRSQSYPMEDTMRKLRKRGFSYVSIARLFNCSSQNVRYHIGN